MFKISCVYAKRAGRETSIGGAIPGISVRFFSSTMTTCNFTRFTDACKISLMDEHVQGVKFAKPEEEAGRIIIITSAPGRGMGRALAAPLWPPPLPRGRAITCAEHANVC